MNARGKQGQTPPHKGKPETAELLRQHGGEKPDTETLAEPPPVSPPPSAEPIPQPTSDEKNALKKASGYLNIAPYSCNGLVEQLEYEVYT